MFSQGKKSRTYSKRNIHGHVVDEIGSRIVSGKWLPGATLPNESMLCEQLEVSRTALREALKTLAAKGMIEPRPKTGTRIRPRDEWNMLDPDVLAWIFSPGPDLGYAADLFEMRRIFEPAAAGLAALRRSDEMLTNIEQAFSDMVLAGEDIDAYVGPDLRFHQLILKASGNKLLAPLGNIIESALAASFKTSSSYPGAIQASRPLHKKVLDAIRARDQAGAENAVRQLIDSARSDIEEILDPNRDEIASQA